MADFYSFSNASRQEHEIAACAARFIVEEGENWGQAKQRAIKALGIPRGVRLPDNDLLENEVRSYIAAFCPDEQAAELLALRKLAIIWLERLKNFQPYLGGAVLSGVATRLSDIHIYLFCDDSKMLEIELINNKISYQVSSSSNFLAGKKPVEHDILSFSSMCRELGEHIGIHLHVMSANDLRGALKPDARGKKYLINLEDLRQLLE